MYTYILETDIYLYIAKNKIGIPLFRTFLLAFVHVIKESNSKNII